MTKLQAIVTLMVIALMSLPAMASFEVLYDFEGQVDAGNIQDVRSAGGSQNGRICQSSGNCPGGGAQFTATGGRLGPQGNTAGMDFVNFTAPTFVESSMVETLDVLDFPSEISYSVDINPTGPQPRGTGLFWTGRTRVAGGQTELVLRPNGSLAFNMTGLNPGAVSATAPGLIKYDGYQTVGFTLGFQGTDTLAEGRTLTYFVDGMPVLTIPGIGLAQATLPGNGHADDSQVQFGWLQNVGFGDQSQFIGFMDNMFISDRLLNNDEMAVLVASFQPTIPEPASLGLLAMGGLAMFGRRRR